MHPEQDSLYQEVRSLFNRGYNQEEISLQLREKGAPENLLPEMFGQLKKLREERKRQSGFLCCGIGAALLVLGFLLTLVLYHGGPAMRFAMYGLTSVGVVFALKGLADLLGW